MVIYADVLIFTNIVIDYILIHLTAAILKIRYKLFAIILASAFGGLTSVYILFQNDALLLDLLVKLTVGIIIVLIAFGFKRMLMPYIVFLLLSFSLNGFVLLLQNFYSTTFFSNNFVYYLNISPILLIVLSMILYLSVRLVQKVIMKKAIADYVEIEICLTNERTKCYALVDSGHTLTDPFSGSQIIIIDSKLYSVLAKSLVDVNSRMRIIPVCTVTNNELLNGLRCDKAIIKHKNKEIILDNPIVLCSNQKLGSDYDAIVSASALINY